MEVELGAECPGWSWVALNNGLILEQVSAVNSLLKNKVLHLRRNEKLKRKIKFGKES